MKNQYFSENIMDTDRNTEKCFLYTASPLDERKTIASTSSMSKVSKIKVLHSNVIPLEITEDSLLNESIAVGLPKNYNFEIYKTIARILQVNARTVLLQFPEGIIRFGPIIIDIISSFLKAHQTHNIKFITMGDLTYGACCIDDYLAVSMGCDLVVHYAHSCLVPINQLNPSIKYLYVFLDIKFDLNHLLECVKHNFKPETHKIALASTIQFVHSVHQLAKLLKDLSYSITLPQSRPLSPAEVLGCTAPKLDPSINTILFICDGRFHLEALMISNPSVMTYRYDPYSRKLTHEKYEIEQMLDMRFYAIKKASEAMQNSNTTVGFVLGTLGRQGSEKVFDGLVNKLTKITKCKYIRIMMPEVTQSNLEAFESIDIWVQVACPRLSIDWGSSFKTPLLNTFEFIQSLKRYQFISEDGVRSEEKEYKLKDYPMDFYAKDSCGDHTPNHLCVNNSNCQCQLLTSKSS